MTSKFPYQIFAELHGETPPKPEGFCCPHCGNVIDQKIIRKAANSIAGKAKRPRAEGLVRNPAGRAKALCSLCGIRPRSAKFPAIIDDEPENICGYCYGEATYLPKQTAPQPKG